MRLLLPVSLALLLGACAATPKVEDPPLPMAPIEVQILAINDFHGRLETPGHSVAASRPDGHTVHVPVGGAAYLASALKAQRAGQAHSVTVAAGDLIGATPLASALFLDEPAIEALDMMGLQYAALGNHEFDKGIDELRRIDEGGCAQFTQNKPCALDGRFDGADFTYLAANVITSGGETLMPASALHDFGDVQVGIIGMPLDDTPRLVAPNLVDGLTFADEAETANALVPALKAQGADAIILVIHEGASIAGRWDDPSCPDMSGGLMGILERLDPEISVVVSGHTHQAYICRVPPQAGDAGRLVTSAGRYGAMLTDIRLRFSGRDGKLIGNRAEQVLVQSAPFTRPDGSVVSTSDAFPRFVPDPEVQSLVARTVEAARPLADRVVGRLSAEAPDHPDDLESPAANLIADSQLAATRASDKGGADFALMNGGGVRTGFKPGLDGKIRYADIFEVQPFGNSLMTVTLTGAQVKRLLEQQFVDDEGRDKEYHLIPSDNFSFAYDLGRPAGDRIVWMRLDGKSIDPAAEYRVTANNFIANGGDGYTVLTEGRDRTGGGLDLDAVIAWLAEGRDPPPVGRIVKLGE